MLLVSHDRVFLDRIVTSTLGFEGDGRVVESVGGYEDYVRQRAGRRSEVGGERVEVRGERVEVRGERVEVGGERSEVGGERGEIERRGTRGARARRLSYHEVRELESLPARIAALETEQVQLQEAIAAPEFYLKPTADINTALARLDGVGAELDALLTRWMELEERQ